LNGCRHDHLRTNLPTKPRSAALFAVSAAQAAFTVYAALRTPGLMDQFRELFRSFGAPTSPLTQFVLDAPNFWWVIAVPAVAVCLWIAFKPQVTEIERRRMKLAVIGVLVFGAAVYGLVAFALYTPMFEIGKTV
jgi:type II secretory pathway component PulF